MPALAFDSVPPLATGSVARPFVRIQALTKRFGAFEALRNVSLDIEPGEFVCFLGPSGCGKTTLLRAIAGLDRQSEGRIEIGGRDVSHMPPAARDFGIVFQSYALFPNLTVRQNVAYGLVNRRVSRTERSARVRELLELVGLPEQINKYPVQLSGGQQQRVALARALATSPSLLLLDEPLSALDARVRVRLRDEIKLLQRRLGVTAVMVTHDQEEALSMADRIVVMNQGIIEQVGTPSEIYREPSNAFVADFVGAMTFLKAEVAGEGEVHVGGIMLKAPRASGLRVGSPIRIGLRPEEIRVRDLPIDPINRICVRVALLDFLGAFCRAKLVPVVAPEAVITADFSANLMRDMQIREGQDLPILLPAESLRIFPGPEIAAPLGGSAA